MEKQIVSGEDALDYCPVDAKWFHIIKQIYFYIPDGLYKYLLFDFSFELVIMPCCFPY